MTPLIKLALGSESGDGLVGYVLILAPLAAVLGLVVLTLVMSSPSSR